MDQADRPAGRPGKILDLKPRTKLRAPNRTSHHLVPAVVSPHGSASRSNYELVHSWSLSRNRTGSEVNCRQCDAPGESDVSCAPAAACLPNLNVLNPPNAAASVQPVNRLRPTHERVIYPLLADSNHPRWLSPQPRIQPIADRLLSAGNRVGWVNARICRDERLYFDASVN